MLQLYLILCSFVYGLSDASKMLLKSAGEQQIELYGVVMLPVLNWLASRLTSDERGARCMYPSHCTNNQPMSQERYRQRPSELFEITLHDHIVNSKSFVTTATSKPLSANGGTSI
jgi:hypothetical protein